MALEKQPTEWLGEEVRMVQFGPHLDDLDSPVQILTADIGL